ncbi:anhydro-N-acetylmuramic acid kinase [Tamlana sp. 2_MG-2023]|uniref:anhydro-N-acetylmuramic acid kinase n=1 Tax=unclassified Tamlana TaxID=2614803 RepID=UPI0026E41859|nr:MULTISPECIES: anhydro-N-acetylmuramic acid kinase [unclassified Tamlana]MDO6760914.1 anhydro-N-acetylmuramic acid kinase [Tamlana sp. 2_MG-2023]MDO6791170.1 anhydro-N-acetylmuramic acid kinase [Tamlana sp. 1_MG-2023]
MLEDKYHVIGVMSGTSLDGIDLVEINFQFKGEWQFEILKAETVSYPSFWKTQLSALVSYSEEKLKRIDADYTVYLAEVIKTFIQKHNLKDIDAVCSHGHTALHQPEKGMTLQIGNLPEISKLIGEKVVCDFRVQDVLFGGQGAPLVPIGDQFLFSNYDFCLNLGGFANVSSDINGVRIAYDICPVNIVLNHYVNRLGFDYDDGGKIASKGVLNMKLLDELNALSFYKAAFPKSLGLEWVKEQVLPLIDSYHLEVADILKTFVEHIAFQIATQFKIKETGKVLVTGGGAYNIYLVNALKGHTSLEIIIPSKRLVEFKEALIFGFLGVLKLRNEVNCLQSVTGASKNHSSGEIFLA